MHFIVLNTNVNCTQYSVVNDTCNYNCCDFVKLQLLTSQTLPIEVHNCGITTFYSSLYFGLIDAMAALCGARTPSCNLFSDWKLQLWLL
ncbi:hypothetical protein XELAEV_18042660mg [Xenopus laevis]|uniref:Uncharacterized protein n=1 Tax=Xenopus laevis TaxID=8355 RepID=A0A974H6Q9_XENLA|nr:hypothetical protein XELAEV_18042660mg [Xenopus laevis]